MATEWKDRSAYICGVCGQGKESFILAKKCCGDPEPIEVKYIACGVCGFVPDDELPYCPYCAKQETEKIHEWNKLVKGE